MNISNYLKFKKVFSDTQKNTIDKWLNKLINHTKPKNILGIVWYL